MWWTILPYVLVTVAVVVLPGFVVNFAAGLRPVQAVGYAPLASVGLISVAAIAADLVGVSWSALPVLVATAVVAVLAGLTRLLIARLAPARAPARALDAASEAPVWWRSSLGWTLGSLVIAATVLAIDGVRNSIGDDGMSTAPVLSTALGFAPNGVPFATFGLTPDSNGIVLGMGYSNSYGWDLLSYSDYLGYGDGMIAQSINPDGTLAVAFRDISNSRASVTLYYYGDFAYFSDISADTVDYLTIASAPDNSIYLAYSDNSVGGKATQQTGVAATAWQGIRAGRDRDLVQRKT